MAAMSDVTILLPDVMIAIQKVHPYWNPEYFCAVAPSFRLHNAADKP